MNRKDVSGTLLALLALSMSLLVLNVAVKQAKAVPDPWEMPVVYIQAIELPPTKLRVNVAVYNLTNTFYATDEKWDVGEPLGPPGGPVSRYNYSLGNIYAFEIQMSWNPAVLGYLSKDNTVPRTNTPQPFRSKGILNAPVVMGIDEVNSTAGTCRVGYTSQNPAASFNTPAAGDAANMFSLTYNIIVPGGNYGLNLDSVILVADTLRFPGVQPQVPWRAVLDPALTTNVGVEAAPRNKDVVGETKLFDTYALVKNAGTASQTITARVYAMNNTHTIQVGTASTPVPVAAGVAQTLKVPCSTAGLKKGTYTIKANVTAVAGETYTADNTVTQGTIIVTLPGDVDGSKNVNIFDIVKMAGGYGAPNQAATNYDPYSDLDNSYVINIFDIVTAAGNYGKSWT